MQVTTLEPPPNPYALPLESYGVHELLDLKALIVLELLARTTVALAPLLTLPSVV